MLNNAEINLSHNVSEFSKILQTWIMLSDRLYFHGLQNHWRCFCSHEIKRCLLLGRKAMTNLNSVLKSRDITLLTNICIVEAMVFPGVMYGCEKVKVKSLSCVRLLATPWTAAHQALHPWDFPGKSTGYHSSILAWRIPMDRGAWQTSVHGVAKSQTRLSD